MFIDMLFKTIPRSLRAGVALVVMLLAFGRGLSTIQVLLVPGDDSGVVVGLLSLVVGVVATVAFYYFQSVDGEPKAYDGMETLDKYFKNEQHKPTKATPVFSSHEGVLDREKRHEK